MFNRVFLSLAFGSLVLTGCAGLNGTAGTVADGHIDPSFVKIVTPRVVDTADQMLIIKLSRQIANPNITKAERARLLYERSFVYDKTGLSFLAQLGIMSAIQENLQFAEGYGYFGVMLAMDGKYLEAYDAFDAALELEPTLTSIYSARGIALYYGLRDQMAHEDFSRFYLEDRTDFFRIMWLYIIESKLYPDQARSRLQERFRLVADREDEWNVRLLQVILGVRSEADFWEHVLDGATDEQKTERLCEAYFYLGKYHQIQGETERANDYFRLAMMTNVTYYLEYHYAGKELQRVGGYHRAAPDDAPQNSDGDDQVTADNGARSAK
ncbi:hypothetical protein [Succinimonas amylolytica]|uniref:hypothetical protein n=1 Tax=Succinimonas amylolytica TaxID=83769 RepID=UPI000367A79C|nr:hypothetical protein [Succinimonas amylolytica]